LEQRPEVLKELTLGIEVFNRGPDFDPSLDNVVRVEARRLRQRLKTYYQNEGRKDDLLIELPVGSYIPRFSRRTPPGATPVIGRRWFRLAGLTAALAVVVAALMVLELRRREPPLLAVLPFAEYGAAAGDAARGDAVADDILQLLAETPRLRVISRTSAFRFRTRTFSPVDIHRQLGARALLEGSVKRVGEKTQISARLVHGETGVQIWAGTQEADVSGLDRAERAIAQGVVSALGAGALPSASSHTPPPEARELVAQARFLAARGNQQDRERAVDMYRRVVAVDPYYARAWGELARQLSLNAFQEPSLANRLVPEARESAAQAMRLDPTLAEPHFALARLAWYYDWDWAAAERGWKRVLEINPNNAGAHQAYALALASRRRFGEALAHSRQAVELDPLAYAASNDLGVILYASGRFDEAAAHARASLALVPSSATSLFLLGVVDAARRHYADAIRELEKSAAMQSRAPGILGRLGHAYARAGRLLEARSVLAELECSPEAPHIYAAMVETGLGHPDRVIQLLEQSLERREPDAVFIGVDAVFDPMRRDSRFRELCARAGIPPG
jgi:serine/threonine-protein kinase